MRYRSVLSVLVKASEMHIPPWYWFRSRRMPWASSSRSCVQVLGVVVGLADPGVAVGYWNHRNSVQKTGVFERGDEPTPVAMWLGVQQLCATLSGDQQVCQEVVERRYIRQRCPAVRMVNVRAPVPFVPCRYRPVPAVEVEAELILPQVLAGQIQGRLDGPTGDRFGFVLSEFLLPVT